MQISPCRVSVMYGESCSTESKRSIKLNQSEQRMRSGIICPPFAPCPKTPSHITQTAEISFPIMAPFTYDLPLLPFHPFPSREPIIIHLLIQLCSRRSLPFRHYAEKEEREKKKEKEQTALPERSHEEKRRQPLRGKGKKSTPSQSPYPPLATWAPKIIIQTRNTAPIIQNAKTASQD